MDVEPQVEENNNQDNLVSGTSTALYNKKKVELSQKQVMPVTFILNDPK